MFGLGLPAGSGVFHVDHCGDSDPGGEASDQINNSFKSRLIFFFHHIIELLHTSYTGSYWLIKHADGVLCFVVVSRIPSGVCKWNRIRLQRDKVQNKDWEDLPEMGSKLPTQAKVCTGTLKHLFTSRTTLFIPFHNKSMSVCCSFTPQNKPLADLESNFCRNPDNDSSGPWCYTVEHDTRWEHCNVPSCTGKNGFMATAPVLCDVMCLTSYLSISGESFPWSPQIWARLSTFCAKISNLIKPTDEVKSSVSHM